MQNKCDLASHMQLNHQLLNLKLKDDNTPYDGISYNNYTLNDFLEESQDDLPFDFTLKDLNNLLIISGILPINPNNYNLSKIKNYDQNRPEYVHGEK